MPEKTKKQILFYLDNISLAILVVFFLFLPIFFLSASTDAFILPKQILLTAVVGLSIILLGARSIIEGRIKLRSTPFDLPLFLLIISALISSLMAVNKADSLIAFIPFLFAILLFFVMTNTVKNANQLLIVLAGLVLGAVLASLLSLLSFFSIFPLPFAYTKVTYFNTFGSLLDQAIYFALIIPITAYFVHSVFMNLQFKKKSNSPFETASNAAAADRKSTDTKISPVTMGFAISFVLILAGLGITLYQLATVQKPLILPFETGFRTAFAAISDDTNRILWGFLFGSGPGTYVTDFTRYKPAAFNLDQNIWAFTFFRSSTFALEHLATTGIAGILAFVFLIFRIFKQRSFFLPIILAVASAIILPYSFTLVILFFILLGVFAIIQTHNNPHKFTEVEFYFVALKRGLLAARTEGEPAIHDATSRKYSKLLPIIFFIILLVLTAFPLYYSATYFASDILYQQSLVAFSQNNGLLTYNTQQAAIASFPYRDLYYRGFSQTNIALANALATKVRGSKMSQQDQQNILLLIQQSITAGRNAAFMAPQTSFNWSNLSNIYRNLIGFGDGADKYAIATIQQAIALDPQNPLQYIDLGGIYYQLGNYDDAIRQFQLAINLKGDYANAYYNLGHALEMKGSLAEALTAYQVVRNLVANDAANAKKMDDEISALQAKIAQQNQNAAAQAANTEPSSAPTTVQGPEEKLNINEPKSRLPERNPKVKIPGPTIQPEPTTSITPTPSGSAEKPSLTPEASPTQTP